jgi:hypothetical protein
MACETFPPRILGVFVTEIYEREAGGKYLVVSALAGTELKRWAILARDTIDQFARKEGCDAARFAGRFGWSRIFTDSRVISGAGDTAVYERAIA